MNNRRIMTEEDFYKLLEINDLMRKSKNNHNKWAKNVIYILRNFYNKLMVMFDVEISTYNIRIHNCYIVINDKVIVSYLNYDHFLIGEQIFIIKNLNIYEKDTRKRIISSYRQYLNFERLSGVWSYINKEQVKRAKYRLCRMGNAHREDIDNTSSM